VSFAILSDGPDAVTVSLDGYRLPLRGHCIDELVEACSLLLGALRHGETAVTDAELRAQLPDVAPGALLHAWMFPCFMVRMPVIVFAVDEAQAAIYTRTLSEETGMPLVVLPDRDIESAVMVPTATVIEEVSAFLARFTQARDS